MNQIFIVLALLLSIFSSVSRMSGAHLCGFAPLFTLQDAATCGWSA